MPATEPGRIRNIAVVGHRGVGKTSLVEAMLFQAGKTNRLGTIEAGTTVSDWDDDEHKRQMSLSGALLNLEWQDRKINLIDCPGDPGFQADTFAALRVVEVRIELVQETPSTQGLVYDGASRKRAYIRVRRLALECLANPPVRSRGGFKSV